MDLPNDPILLYGFINMKLRDEYPSLTAFCEAFDVSEDEIISKLNDVGFTYDESVNQFR